jgi:Cu-Zn family superoxide dismutase
MQRALVVAAACAAALAATAPARAAETAKAQLVGPAGEELGEVTLIQGPRGVLITVGATGLAPGLHGFHIHEVGQCQPDFEAAGEHYAPDGNAHGYLADDGYHAGDLPNLHVDPDGTARADFFTAEVSLQADAASTLFDQDGSAFIVHERMDSYGDQPGAGGRIACGAIAPDQ